MDKWKLKYFFCCFHRAHALDKQTWVDVIFCRIPWLYNFWFFWLSSAFKACSGFLRLWSMSEPWRRLLSSLILFSLLLCVGVFAAFFLSVSLFLVQCIHPCAPWETRTHTHTHKRAVWMALIERPLATFTFTEHW